MPYSAGTRLPAERSSHLSHLEVLKSPLVKKLVQNFKNPKIPDECNNLNWECVPIGGSELKYVFSVDGSNQIVNSDTSPYSSIAFVKTALLKVDRHALLKVDKENPHPLILRDILNESVVYHATAFPLRNVWIDGINNYHAIREIIFESIKDDSPEMEGEIMETLKWIVYKKWGDKKEALPYFECPHCHKTEASLPYNAEVGKCASCGNEIYITDMLGFHLDMGDDSAPAGISTTYMIIHETLLLFTAIRNFWDNQKSLVSECLFVKDGPLSIRAQYSKLVEPIRQFLSFARDQGHPVHIIGQEKSGTFYDHLHFIAKDVPDNSWFIPHDTYIKTQIQNRSISGAEYGKDTNYGAKVFVKMNNYHKMVLNIPTGEFNANPGIDDLIGYDKIIATIPTLISNRHEGALLPIELVHGIVSLSTYPSAKILKLFTESHTL